MERKQRLVRERIVQAADELFARKGFDNVSVSDIAAHADVGRTTFFRYFGDKQEVVFAKEQQMLDAIADTAHLGTAGAAATAAEAVEQLRPLVLDLCDRATTDPEAYLRHTELVELHPELRGRDAEKAQLVAVALGDVLIRRGTDELTAVFAAQIALACYQTARRMPGTAASLTDNTRAAFDRARDLGRDATDHPAGAK
jgi:AcrR family transcriptional regulator